MLLTTLAVAKSYYPYGQSCCRGQPDCRSRPTSGSSPGFLAGRFMLIPIIMHDSGCARERQALAKWGLNHVIDEYLARKLADQDSFLP